MKICCFYLIYIIVHLITVGWTKQAIWKWTNLTIVKLIISCIPIWKWNFIPWGCQRLFMFCFGFFLGPEGLLWSAHIWTAVKPRSFHPHQLDGPRWKCLLFILQCLRTISTSLKNTNKMEGRAEVLCERRRHVTHSVFIIMPEYLRSTHPNNHLNPTFYSSQRCGAVLFIKKWNPRLHVL